jgi:hypothetical protein
MADEHEHGEPEPNPNEAEPWPIAESSWFGTIPAPRNLDELTALLRSPGWSGVRAWRGQTRHAWRLDSSAVRRLRGVRSFPTVTESMLDCYEHQLLMAFRQHRFPDTDRIQTVLEEFATIQHYGGATRLLDFTESAFVALWFACREHPTKSGMVFGIEGGPEELHELRSPGPPPTRLPSGVFDWIRDDRPVLWKASALYARMRAQHSIFVFSRFQWEDWGSVNIWPGDRGARPIRAILVTTKLKEGMRLLWSRLFGFSEEVLFPDLPGFGQSHAASSALPTQWEQEIVRTVFRERREEDRSREWLEAMEKLGEISAPDLDLLAPGWDGGDWDGSA